MPKNRHMFCLVYKKLLILFTVLVSIFYISVAFAQNVTKVHYALKVSQNLISAQINDVLISDVNGYDRITISGLINTAPPGKPLLPVKTVRYLVPDSMQVKDIDVAWTSKKTLPGNYQIEPAQKAYPISFKGVIDPTLPDVATYQSYAAYPGKIYEIVSLQQFRGYQILIVNLYPVEYIPGLGAVSYYTNLNLNIDLEPGIDAELNPLFRGTTDDLQAVQKKVDNPLQSASYPLYSQQPLAPGDDVDLLIITSPNFKAYSGVNSLSVLKTHKESLGVQTEIIDTAWIYANYSGTRPDGGTDNQTCIRNCILDYYNNSGIQYVLLVGDSDGNFTDTIANNERQAYNDAERIPHRGFYATAVTETDDNIPADMYYGCLDGTFDNDGDGIYGEINDGPGGADVDLIAEVYVGRAPVDSTTELANFVKKTIAYENSTGTYLNSACFIGEQLDAYTYGKSYMEEIKNGSDTNGYSTVGMNGSGYFSFSSLYAQDRVWQASELSAIINNGVHVINQLGHATNTSFASLAGFANYNVDILTNTNYFFGFTQGCYSGSFDNRSTASSSYETDDCVLEHFVCEPAGAFAFIGNSRYGWYNPNGTDGASQRYQREFWDAVFKEGYKNIGRALADAKEDNIGVINEVGPNRWCYFEYNLLGDPQTSLNIDILSPKSFTASNINFSNSSWVSLNWDNPQQSDFQKIMIRYRTDGSYPANYTDGTLLCSTAAVAGEHSSFNHQNIDANTTYYYAGFGYNGSVYEGNSSVNNRSSVKTIGAGSDDSSRSNCFVATACYGDALAPEVISLKKFRDRYLLKFYAGKNFICRYYTFGPYLADFIRERKVLKNAVRLCLQPLVCLSDILMEGCAR